MAVAYLLFSVALTPGILIFFFARRYIPESVAHATGIRWLDWAVMLLFQVCASAIIMLPMLLATVKACAMFLSESEMKRLVKALEEIEA